MSFKFQFIEQLVVINDRPTVDVMLCIARKADFSTRYARSK